MTNQYEKHRVAFRYFLIGKEYYDTSRAMDFALKYHTGTRKDKVTPEFAHQIGIGQYVRTILGYLMYPQQTLTSVMLHDTPEDYPETIPLILPLFGTQVERATSLLNKKGKTTEYYYASMADDPIASIVKGADRINNMGSMVGVFNMNKQLEYIDEVENHILPMLKIARRNFPAQENAYENIKFMLRSQVSLISEIHKEVKKGVDAHNATPGAWV